MVAVGGSIGTGLLLGSGAAMEIAGPAAILSFVVAALISWTLAMALGELACAHPAAGSPPVSAAPYYIAINAGSGTATVRRTATGARIAAVPRRRGMIFFAVAAAPDDRTFVLAAQTSAVGRFYRLRLGRNGRPGRLALTAVPPTPRKLAQRTAPSYPTIVRM